MRQYDLQNGYRKGVDVKSEIQEKADPLNEIAEKAIDELEWNSNYTPIQWRAKNREIVTRALQEVRPWALRQLEIKERELEEAQRYLEVEKGAVEHLAVKLQQAEANTRVLLDCVDYMAGNCKVNDMVGAVLDASVIRRIRAAIEVKS